jgi:heme A synthase
MLFVQVILGGGATILGFPIIYHIAWGSLTFVMLIVTTALGGRTYGRASNIFRVGIAAILVFVLQGTLGFLAFDSDVVVVVHLANAFILGILVTYFIVFSDSAEKALAPMSPASS